MEPTRRAQGFGFCQGLGLRLKLGFRVLGAIGLRVFVALNPILTI